MTGDFSDIDFGFSFVDQDELDTVKKAKENAASWQETSQKRVEDVLSAIMPFLKNLKGDKNKDTILWPGDLRHEQIDKFIERLNHLAD